MLIHEDLKNTKAIIQQAWNDGANVEITPMLTQAIHATLQGLDTGNLRVAEKRQDESAPASGTWQVNQWIKQAILLSFKIQSSQLLPGAPGGFETTAHWFDKIPGKFSQWNAEHFQAAQIRAVPGSFVRAGAFIGPRVILMPSFVNIGAYVGEGTLIDTWVTIGSCAQIGKNCHISGGVGIGGVLEPIQANPVIIEDNCFIGARSEIAEGVVVEEGAVISMGVFIGASTRIVDRETGDVFYGRIPAYSVVVPGTLPGRTLQDPSLACAVIVKRVDHQTRSKTAINDLLRL